MLKNILSNWFGMLVLGLVSVVLTPTMVHGLGNLHYGMWVLVGSFTDYSGLLDMGMRAAVFRYVAYFKGANQRIALNQTFATGVAIALSSMCVCMLISIGLSFILPSFFGFNGANRTTFSWIVVLIGVSVSVAIPGQFLSAYLRGLERFDLYNLGLIVHGLIRGALLLTLLKMGFGILSVAIGVLIMSVFFLVLHGFLVKWADRHLKLSIEYLDRNRTREMFKYGVYCFINNSGETLRYSTDSSVIGRMLSIALITPFSIASRLMEYFRVLIGGVGGPIMVRLSDLSGKVQETELSDEFLRATRFSMLLCIFVGGMLILNGAALIRLWMGSAYLSSYPILVVLTVGYIGAWGQSPSGLLVFARARHHKALSYWTLAEGGANLVLSIALARKYGLLGIALGTAIPLLLSKALIQPWYALRDLGMSAWTYFSVGLARSIFVGGLFLGGSWVLLHNAPPATSFFSLAAICVGQSVLFAAITYVFGLPAGDRTTVRIQGQRVATSLGIARSV